jgi:outer membrane protein OmpA-like peptidoglycan-associated protein
MVNYLINRGINAKRLTAKGYGGTKPVTANITASDRQLNRRINMRVIN